VPASSLVYVYGILPASDAESATATGVEGRAVRAVVYDGLAALVSDLQSGSLAAVDDVRAHWRVLDEASQQGTVLPMRFGTVMEGEEAVRQQLLAPNAQRLERLLGDLAGRVQVSVKGDYDEDALLRDVVSRSPAIAALRDRVRSIPDAAGYYDRIELGEMVAGEIARRQALDAQTAVERLQSHAVATRAGEPSGTGQAFTIDFLIDRSGMEGFGRAVSELGDAMAGRVAIRYVGPLPPYSFADGELAAGSGAWA